jgi:hypothetical protein
MSLRVLIPRVPSDPIGFYPGYWSGSRRVGFVGCGPEYLYAFLFCRPDDEVGCRMPLDRRSTANPTGTWVTQQARQFTRPLQQQPAPVRFLLRDRPRQTRSPSASSAPPAPNVSTGH